MVLFVYSVLQPCLQLSIVRRRTSDIGPRVFGEKVLHAKPSSLE